MKIVQKYGGSSLADVECVRRVASRVKADAKNNRMLVVVSAQGKTTDALTKQYKELSFQFPSRESDALLVTGEQASASLLASALMELGVDAVSLNGIQVPVQVAGKHGDGRIKRIDTSRVYKEWSRGKVIIVTGFQGINNEGDFITLGRGGSDTSAVALAAALKADRCMIFTDVDGVYSTDPRKEPNAIRFQSIHEDTMLDLALNGAKVLHPRAVALAKQYQVPLEVLTSFSTKEGTVVSPLAPRKVGITMREEMDDAVITIVFNTVPSGEILSTLCCIAADFQSNLNFGCNIMHISVPKNMADSIIQRFHAVLYP